MRRATLRRRAVRTATMLCAAAGALLSAQMIQADDTEPPKTPEPAPTPIAREFGLSDIAPRLTLHGFADVTANIYFDDVEGAGNSSHNYFALGELDLFLVSHLADNISFLSELVFESDTDGDGYSAAGGVGCSLSDCSDSTPAAGSTRFYLIRARNGCPGGVGSLGHRSDGTEIAGRVCP